MAVVAVSKDVSTSSSSSTSVPQHVSNVDGDMDISVPKHVSSVDEAMDIISSISKISSSPKSPSPKPKRKLISSLSDDIDRIGKALAAKPKFVERTQNQIVAQANKEIAKVKEGAKVKETAKDKEGAKVKKGAKVKESAKPLKEGVAAAKNRYCSRKYHRKKIKC